MASELGPQVVTPRKRPRARAWPRDQQVGGRDRRDRRQPGALGRWLRQMGRRVSGSSLLPTVLLVGLAMAAYAVVTSSAFSLKKVIVVGTLQLSSEDIESPVRERLRQSIFAADLDALREELKKIPLVKEAEISRLLPDTIIVRITERTPAALVARLNHTPVVVDDEGVILGDYHLLGETTMPLLVGWDEEESDRAADENRRRVAFYRQLRDELSRPPDLWNKIDQLNLRSLEDVVIHLTESPETRLHLGNKDFRSRLELALAILEALRKHDAAGLRRLGIIPSEEMLQGDVTVSYLDVSQPTRVVIRLAEVTRNPSIPSDEKAQAPVPSPKGMSRSPATRDALIKRHRTR